MKIFKLHKNRITFDKGLEFTLSYELIEEFKLKEKEFLDENEFDTLLERSALQYGYYLLGIKNYFSGDLEKKIREKFYSSSAAEKAVEQYIEKGYIDDTETARFFAETHRNYGNAKIRFELKNRGVSQSVIDEILEGNSEEQKESIRKLIKKMDGKSQDKIIASLMRKGFSYDLIKDILRER